jgi:hypothetical protein
MLHPPNQTYWRVRSHILILSEGLLFECFVYFVVNSDCMEAQISEIQSDCRGRQLPPQ